MPADPTNLYSLPTDFISIDEQGFVHHNGRRIEPDSESEGATNDVVKEFFTHLEKHDATYVSRYHSTQVIVEAFDEPLVAHNIDLATFTIQLLYGIEIPIEPNFFSDDFDRFHGVSTKKIPFVLSRVAQENLFEQCDSFDDDSFTYKGKTFEVRNLLLNTPNNKNDIDDSTSWDSAYNEGRDGWNTMKPAPALVEWLPKLKLAKQRVLVLGCGEGHDAAFIASKGHQVTAVDFSSEALKRAQERYSQHNNIRWVHADVFKLPTNFESHFDFIFEHTCFCAVRPQRRDELIRVWRKCLAPEGYLFAIVFANQNRNGPPWGGTEFEMRSRLKKGFRFLHWHRVRNSWPKRMGAELFIFAQKRNLI